MIARFAELLKPSSSASGERPFITFGYCAIVSPLTMDFDSTEMLMYFAENGLPAYGTLAPIGGISARLKMSGMLVQMNAEWHCGGGSRADVEARHRTHLQPSAGRRRHAHRRLCRRGDRARV